MKPRTKMFTMNSKTLFFEALHQINQNGFSRIPIYGSNPDDIIGFVHVRDVLKELEYDHKMKTLGEISRKPVFGSQEKMVSALLKEMKGRKTHMAVVIDEHGGVEGLITLEDLIEEIEGDIEDESDHVKPKEYERIDKDTIMTDGDIPIDRINSIFKTQIPLGDDYSSLNGLLHEKLQDIAKAGDKIEIEDLRIVVEKVLKNVPQKIRIERIKI